MQDGQTADSERWPVGLAKESFGEQLYRYRSLAQLSQGSLALAAGVSKAYVSELENERRRPPPRRTARRLAKALRLSEGEANRLVAIAVIARGAERPDDELPSEVRQLIADLRAYAFQLPVRFVHALRKTVKEIVM